MRANDMRSTDPVRHGAYFCVPLPEDGTTPTLAGAAVPALAARLGLCNEFEPGNADPPLAIAYLRRIAATPGVRADDGLAGAHAVVHVAAPTSEPVEEFRAELCRLLGPRVRVLAGVVRPMVFTGNAMYNFAYAHRVLQQPGPVAPNAFLVPMTKTTAWWAKSWMERHTYFLPRYDGSGRRQHEGHALAAAAGVASLMRRTYKCPAEPAAAGEYDFLTYFECADDAVATFHEVCAALRDVSRNPEWAFVQEGPTWHGRRVATWPDLFT
jgi:hypothetical protein